jgi:hypothetical protein
MAAHELVHKHTSFSGFSLRNGKMSSKSEQEEMTEREKTQKFD